MPFEGLKFHRIKQFFLLSYHHNLIFDNHFTLLCETTFSPIFSLKITPPTPPPPRQLWFLGAADNMIKRGRNYKTLTGH